MVYSPISNAGRKKVEMVVKILKGAIFQPCLRIWTTELIKTMQLFLYSMVMNSQQIGAWATLFESSGAGDVQQD